MLNIEIQVDDDIIRNRVGDEMVIMLVFKECVDSPC